MSEKKPETAEKPDTAQKDEDALSDEELESAAGGVGLLSPKLSAPKLNLSKQGISPVVSPVVQSEEEEEAIQGINFYQKKR